MTKKMPKTQRMNQIIQAALDEFLNKGYEGASMEGIARKARISKGGLYHHFKSKDEILLFANRKFDEPLNKIRMQASEKNSAENGLVYYLEQYLNYWKQHEREIVFYSLSITKIMDSPDLWQMYETYFEKYIDFIQALFQRGIDAGEFLDHSARESAITLIAALDGIVFYLLIDKKLKLEEIILMFRKKFISQLKVIHK
jgi:AcrR family transcriptional regulator